LILLADAARALPAYFDDVQHRRSILGWMTVLRGTLIGA
jgi:hypothetical protein